MTNDVPVNRCPGCGAEVPPEAPQGLCPKCLLAGVAQPTEQVATVRVPDTLPRIEAVAAGFPQLDLIECIGHGGMGVVYKARQTKLERLVALKILPQRLATDAAFRERFTREGRVLARLNHPNIVTVYDFGEAGGFFYLLMEYVDGANLRQAMRAGRFTPAQALEIVPKICEALQYAHGEGILHRDIKPENILLDTKGRVKIADFGIAKLMGDRADGGTLTATGATIGTPQYMAPEQLEHPQDVDHRADIYSLGVVFYEMLTGELPIGRFAPPSAKTPVDSRVDEVVFRTLEKEREKRFQSAGAVKTEVEGITSSLGQGVAESVPPATRPTPATGQVPGGPEADRRGLAEFVPPTGRAVGGAGDAASATPIRIRPEHRPLVLMGLAVVLALLGLRLLPLPALLIGTLAGSFQAGIVPAVWNALAIAAGGSLIGAAWVHRRRLLEPLGITATELEESEAVALWASQRILGTMAVAVLMAVTAHVAVQVVLVFAALFGFVTRFAWPTLLALVGGLALAWWLIRGRASATSADAVAPAPWERRVAVLFLILGGAALLASAASSGGGIRYSHLDVLLAVTGVALLTRSCAWRTAALVINSLLASLGAAQILALLLLLTRGDATEVGSVAGSVGLGTACVLAVFETLAFVAGLWVLCRAEGRPTLEKRPSPPTAAARTDAGTAPLCRAAVWSVGVVGSSLALALVGLAFIALGVSSLFSMGAGAGPKPSLLLLGLLALAVLATAITGTVLGVVGWRQIGRSGGRLRGKALAVIGALTWPVLVVLLGPLLLLSVGYFTLQVERPMVSPVVRYEGPVAIGQGVVRQYWIPAGQAAVFEVVTQDGSSVAALPGYAAYALAPADGQAEASVRLEPGFSDGDAHAKGRWQFMVTYGGSSAMADGLVLPDAITAPIPSNSASVALEPEGERLDWIVPRSDHSAALGVRARTSPHGLTGIEPGGPRSYGVGTNWLGNAKIGGG